MSDKRSKALAAMSRVFDEIIFSHVEKKKSEKAEPESEEKEDKEKEVPKKG